MLVGLDTSDDAAVYKINNDKAIIHTIDFFTPVVDDPFIFGQIAATNALSDVYAMGGEVLMALNIVCFPSELNIEILRKILQGGADKIKEAGGVIGGGHSIEDREPKYGLSVMGMIHPKKIIKNNSAVPGDILVLTKPIGTGIILTGIKGELTSPDEEKEAIEVMSELNKIPGELMKELGANACTDITGFGLLGHSCEMATASEVTFVINYSNVPYLKPAKNLAQMGIIPAGAYRNKNYFKKFIKYFDTIPEILEDIFYDPQTSGGLLISISEEKGKILTDKLNSKGIMAKIIGKVVEKCDHSIILKK